MTPREVSEFDRLVSAFCEGSITPEEFAALERTLRDSAEYRRRYLELTALHGSLGWAHSAAEPPAAPVPPSTRRHGRWAVAACGLAAAVALAAWAVFGGTPGGVRPDDGARQVADERAAVPAPEAFARLVEVGGQTELRDGAGVAAAAGEGSSMFPGQTLRTAAADGFAVLDLGGGSRLELSPDAQLRVADRGDSGRPRLILTAGLLRGTVGARDLGVTVQTPQAEVRLTDARFLVSAAPDVTEVEAEAGSVRVLRLADGQVLDVPAGSSTVVSDADPMELRATAPATATPRAEYKVAAHWGLAFDRDGGHLVARQKTAGWARIDLTTGRSDTTRLPTTEPVATVLSADGQTFVAVARGGRVRVHDVRTGAERTAFESGVGQNWAWAVAGDGSRLAAVHLVTGPGERVRVWDARTGREGPAVPADGPSPCAAVSADGRLVAWASDGTRKRPGHTLAVWDAAAAKVVATIAVPERPLRELAFSPDGRRVVGATDHGAVHVWEADTGRWVAGRGSGDGWARPVRAVAFGPDGRRVAAGLADGRARVWDVGATGDAAVLACGRGPLNTLAFDATGRVLAAGTNRGTVTLWDLPPQAAD